MHTTINSDPALSREGYLNVTMDFLVMAKLVIISANVPKKISVDQILYVLTNLVITHVTVKLDS